MNSQIINQIRTDPNWMETLETLNVRAKINDDNVAIFNYGIDADFTNPIVREARGIIIDLNNLRVLCRGFQKFCNIQEAAAKIDLEHFDWNNFRAEEKIDGSIMKLYWMPLTHNKDDWLRFGIWRWATNSCMNAFSPDATAGTSGKTFGELIESAINFDDIPFDKLKKDCTYIFELVTPLHPIVIKYPYTKLYHIGTRNNKTGEEYRVDIGIERPKVYDIHSMEDCMSAVEKLNKSSTVTNEGFVVVDQYWHRVKIKSPEYVIAHKMWNNGNMSKESALRWLLDHDTNEIAENMTELTARLKFYDYQIAALTLKIDRYISYVRALYEEYGHDRKAVANTIKNDRLSAFGFAAIGNEKTAQELVLDTKISSLMKLIPDYEEESWREFRS